MFVVFIAVYFAGDAAIVKSGIAQYHLWHGNEPAATSILKGTNPGSGGSWNPNDAALHEQNGYDYDKTERDAWQIIAQRLKSPYILNTAGLFCYKLASQWAMGDFMGVYWSQNGSLPAGVMTMTRLYGQIFYIALLIAAFWGLKKNRRQPGTGTGINKCDFMPLFCLIFLGFAALYLISETQPRYGYIACWVFLMFVG